MDTGIWAAPRVKHHAKRVEHMQAGLRGDGRLGTNEGDNGHSHVANHVGVNQGAFIVALELFAAHA